jgi:hypothetical protein
MRAFCQQIGMAVAMTENLKELRYSFLIPKRQPKSSR